MRLPSVLLAPLVTFVTLFGAGLWLKAAGMLHARLSFADYGGPAAYVLYGVVVGLGVLNFLLDLVFSGLRASPPARAPVSARKSVATQTPARTFYDRPVTLRQHP